MLLAFFIFGLIIGSFLNVVVYRIREVESLMGRSKCPHCGEKIRWYDNIPLLSFILLKGSCRDCQKKISWQYPLVESLTGIIFILVGWKFFEIVDFRSWYLTSYFLILVSFLLAILIYDFLYMEIPSVVLWPGIILALIFNAYLDWELRPTLSFYHSASLSGILAAGGAFLFFFSISYFSKEKWMGMGDAYLAILLGLILGWPYILLALLLSFSIGSIYGIILVINKKKTMKSQIPFAPFMVLGAFIVIFFGGRLASFFNFY